MFDVVAAWSAILLPTALGVAGYRLAAVPQSQPGLARILVIAGIATSAIAGWQHGRLRGASSEAATELRDQIEQQRDVIAAQEVKLHTLSQQLAEQKQAELDRRKVDLASLDPVIVPLHESDAEPAAARAPRARAEPQISRRESLVRFVASGKRLRDRCLTDPPNSSLDREADRWFADVLSFLRGSLGSPYVSEFMNPRPAGAVPEGIAEDRIPLWRGLDQRLDALNRFEERVRS